MLQSRFLSMYRKTHSFIRSFVHSTGSRVGVRERWMRSHLCTWHWQRQSIFFSFHLFHSWIDIRAYVFAYAYCTYQWILLFSRGNRMNENKKKKRNEKQKHKKTQKFICHVWRSTFRYLYFIACIVCEFHVSLVLSSIFAKRTCVNTLDGIFSSFASILRL